MSEGSYDMGLNSTFCKSLGCIEMSTSSDKMNDHFSDKSCTSCVFFREYIYFTLILFSSLSDSVKQNDHSAGQNWLLVQK